MRKEKSLGNKEDFRERELEREKENERKKERVMSNNNRIDLEEGRE